MARATAAQVRAWRERGWVLVPGLVPASTIDEAVEELWRLYPRPDEFHAGGGGERRRAFTAGVDERALFGGDGGPAPEGPDFRAEQFLGRRQFPFPGRALNALAVHDALIDFAERALGSTDLRLYQLGVWGKYTGVADYEQPMHQDHNHSVVPPRNEPGWWHLEGFLYLTDVDADDLAPTRVVGLDASGGRLAVHPVAPGEAPELYAAEVPAAGPRGSFLAYRSDVFHRAVDLTRPGGARFLYNLSFKLAGHDWIGYENAQPSSTVGRFVRFVEGCSPRQLALLGVPRPGHPYWTAAQLDAMAARYPRLDLTPWRSALRPA